MYAQQKVLLPVLILCTCIVPIYFILSTYHHSRKSILNQLTHIPPLSSSSLNFTFSSVLYYLDLQPFPIEATILRLFPTSETTIKSHILGQLAPLDKVFDCQSTPLPYSLLRQLVQEYTGLRNTDTFFDSHQHKAPFVHLPPVRNFPHGTKICVRVIVPYQNKSRHDRLLYQPYPEHHAAIVSPWWDIPMTWITDIDNGTVPIPMQPWSGHRLLREDARASSTLPAWVLLRQELMSERETTHVYEADLVVNRSGTIMSRLEFIEGRYNFEYGPVSTYEPMDLGMFPIHVEEEEEKVGELPLCQGMDHPGRWLPAKGGSVTRHGKYWAPFACRYRHMTYEAFYRCAGQKYRRIHVYGDSNSRRSLKKFVSHGRWCQGWEKLHEERESDGVYESPQSYRYLHPNQTRSCFCEDYREYAWNSSWFDATARMTNLTLENSAQQRIELGQTEWDGEHGDQVTLYSYKWDGLTFLNEPGWETAVPSMPQEADVAIFSVGNWDASFSQLDVFLKDLDTLIQQIKGHYDLTKTKIIYRTPQYYCCRVDTSDRARQVSGPRLDVFDKEARKRFQNELNATIWDTYMLGESKTWEEKNANIDCSSNHVPADEVEIENQILMNGLCNSF